MALMILRNQSFMSFTREHSVRARIEARQCIAWVLLAISLAPTLTAQAQLQDTVCFGDSLTHNDLLGWAYGNPQDMYGFDPMEAAFNKGAQNGDELTSYAVGGSESWHLEDQIDLYFLDRFFGNADQATLFNIEIGANDILNNDPLLGANPPGVDPAADALVDAVIDNIADGLQTLWLSGPSAQFVIWTIPDVTSSPDLWSKSDSQKDNLRAHVQRINRSIHLLSALNNVAVVDTYWLFRRHTLHPPILFGHSLIGPPAYGDYDHLFADELHFTAVSNGLLGNQIIKTMNQSFGGNIPGYSHAELAALARIPRYGH